MRRINRRRFLYGVGTTLAVGAAGCTGSSSSDTGENNDESTIEILDHDYEQSSPAHVDVTGRVRNTGSTEFSSVSVWVYAYQGDERVGEGVVTLMNLRPDETAEFTVIVDAVEFDHYEIEVEAFA